LLLGMAIKARTTRAAQKYEFLVLDLGGGLGTRRGERKKKRKRDQTSGFCIPCDVSRCDMQRHRDV